MKHILKKNIIIIQNNHKNNYKQNNIDSKNIFNLDKYVIQMNE